MKRSLLVIFVSALLSWLAYERTDGFGPNLIGGPLFAPHSEPLSPEISSILNQRFSYLSKGRQSFVFQSADGKYVLKFFNQKYLQMPWYSFLVEEKEKKKRELRRHFYENSYPIAYRELGEGIVYLHLGPSDSLPTVSFIDKASGEHTLNLNAFPFVLQKKGTLLYEGLNEIYREKGLAGLQKEIDSFLRAISLRISKNIADGDSDIEHNWGYVEGEIFHLDPGRLYYEDLSDPIRLGEEWQRATFSLHQWLQLHYPEAVQYLDCQLYLSRDISREIEQVVK